MADLTRVLRGTVRAVVCRRIPTYPLRDVLLNLARRVYIRS